VLAAGIAAAVGVAERPGPTPAQWVAGVLATTARAGSAHFSYANDTKSPDPDQRGTLSGSGVVDFARGDVRVSEIDHQITFEGAPRRERAVATATMAAEIGIGRVAFQRFVPSGFPVAVTGAHFLFTKLPFPRQPRSGLGLSLALSASVALSALVGPEPVAAVRDLGPATVNGRATTEYQVQMAPVATCPSQRRVAPVSTQGPTLLWVDGAGRLVQARTTWRFSGYLPPGLGKLPGFAAFPVRPSTTTATLTFSAFGAPVRIAPPPSALAVAQRSSTGYASSVALHACGSKAVITVNG
jgi:hypothetical protein